MSKSCIGMLSIIVVAMTMALIPQGIEATDDVSPMVTPISSCSMITVPGEYVLTVDIQNVVGSCMTIQASNVLFDGAGYMIDGDDSGSDIGIFATSLTNVTIKNLKVTDFNIGIEYSTVLNSKLMEDTLTSNNYGLYFVSTSNTNVENINSSGNTGDGIYLYRYNYDNTISWNNLSNNGGNGLYVRLSDRNEISNNTMTYNANRGIYFTTESKYNDVVRNNFSKNVGVGIGLYSLPSGNNITYNYIWSNGIHGISMTSSTTNNLVRNNTLIANIGYGVYADDSTDGNHIYHNNFINNNGGGKQGNNIASLPQYCSFWNDSYPSGGNYWSDHTSPDTKSGPNQDQPGADGIVDTPYGLDGSGGCHDQYPITSQVPIVPELVPSWALTLTVVIALALVAGCRKRN